MKNKKYKTSLPKRRLQEQPPPEKRPKWSKILGTVLKVILIWMPRLWKLFETIQGWISSN